MRMARWGMLVAILLVAGPQVAQGQAIVTATYPVTCSTYGPSVGDPWGCPVTMELGGPCAATFRGIPFIFGGSGLAEVALSLSVTQVDSQLPLPSSISATTLCGGASIAWILAMSSAASAVAGPLLLVDSTALVLLFASCDVGARLVPRDATGPDPVSSSSVVELTATNYWMFPGQSPPAPTIPPGLEVFFQAFFIHPGHPVLGSYSCSNGLRMTFL